MANWFRQRHLHENARATSEGANHQGVDARRRRLLRINHSSMCEWLAWHECLPVDSTRRPRQTQTSTRVTWSTLWSDNAAATRYGKEKGHNTSASSSRSSASRWSFEREDKLYHKGENRWELGPSWPPRKGQRAYLNCKERTSASSKYGSSRIVASSPCLDATEQIRRNKSESNADRQ